MQKLHFSRFLNMLILPMFIMLLAHSSMLFAQSKDELNNELFIAIQNGDAGRVQQLIASGADPNAKNDKGSTALTIAVLMDKPDIARILLNAGADINAKNDVGATPLMAAATGGSVEMINLLLQYNADINAKNDRGDTALDYAILNDNIDVARRQGHDDYE